MEEKKKTKINCVLLTCMTTPGDTTRLCTHVTHYYLRRYVPFLYQSGPETLLVCPHH